MEAPQKAAREEFYEQITAGAELDAGFLLLTALSTVVAAIGLITYNTAVVIGGDADRAVAGGPISRSPSRPP